MKIHKTYRAFASRGYRILTCALIPAGMLILQGILWKISFTLFYSMLLTAWFSLSDHWVFGGVCSKEHAGMEYLKSSSRGMTFLQNALTADCLLRFAVIVVIIGISALEQWFFQIYFSGSEMHLSDALLRILQQIFVSYAVSALAITICRHFTLLAWNMCTAYIGSFLTVILLSSFCSGMPLILSVITAAAASALLSFITVKKPIRNVRKSYYDETNKI